MANPAPLTRPELTALHVWLDLNPDKGLPAHAVRRLLATITQARRETDAAFALLAAELTPDNKAR